MWVFCAGMYRSGSTLQYQIVAKLVEKCSVSSKILGWSHHEKFKDIASHYSSYEGFIVYKNHVLTREMKELVGSKQAYVFYIYRDIRDVAVSMMQKSGITFERLLSSGSLDSCIEHYYDCTSMGSAYIAKYESVVGNIESEVFSIADYLNFRLKKKDGILMADDLSLSSQLEVINSYKIKNKFIEESEQIFHPKTLLHHNHIKDGLIGKYKDVLHGDEISMLNMKYEHWMNDAGYNIGA